MDKFAFVFNVSDGVYRSIIIQLLYPLYRLHSSSSIYDLNIFTLVIKCVIIRVFHIPYKVMLFVSLGLAFIKPPGFFFKKRMGGRFINRFEKKKACMFLIKGIRLELIERLNYYNQSHR